MGPADLLRKSLLTLAADNRVRDLIERAPVSRSVVKRYVPGAYDSDAVAAVATLRATGRWATIDFLGEDTTDPQQAEAVTTAYLRLLDLLAADQLTARGEAEVSVKLSAIGQQLEGGDAIALANARRICEAAQRLGTTVTLDMEDHTTTDRTLTTLATLRADYPWVGVAIQAYLHRSEADCAALAGEGVDPMKFRWETLTRSQTVDMRAKLKERYAPATANKMLSVLRGVLRAARDLGLMNEGQYQTAASLELIKAPKADSAAPVDDDAVAKLLAACFAEPGASGRRDAAMLVIFLCSGLRRAEAAALDVADYDPETGRLHIRGERPEYDRVVTLPVPARRVMEQWLEVRTTEPGPLLTPVDRGGLLRFRRMTDQAVYDIFGRITARAGLSNVTLRDLRRSYVVSLIRAGKPVNEVQYLTGHASWVTTSAYRGLADDTTAAAFEIEASLAKALKGGTP